jgi:hypothetical protein
MLNINYQSIDKKRTDLKIESHGNYQPGKKSFFIHKTFLVRSTRLIAFCLLTSLFSYGQDPVLPAMNLGLTNIQDAVSPPPGIYYNNYNQIFQTRANYGPESSKLPGDLKINYLLTLQQVVFLSPIKLFDGNVHFTALLPIVKISASNPEGAAPSVNQSAFGDLTLGGGIQWSGKSLLNHPLWHRFEFDINLPTGSYNQQLNINPSAHLYALAAYYSFTYFITPNFSIGSRNQFNFNFNQIACKTRSGSYYNGNYSIEYNLFKTFRLALAGYYLKQFNQDTYNGNTNYYRKSFGINDTREKVLGIGPALSYTTGSGIFMEAKVFFESEAQNRAAGSRPTLRFAFPLK